MKRKIMLIITIISMVTGGCSSSKEEHYNLDNIGNKEQRMQQQIEVIDSEKQDNKIPNSSDTEVELEYEEKSTDKKNDESDIGPAHVWDYDFYYNVLEKNTDYYIDNLIVDDFDGNGIQEAFAFTVSDEDCFGGMGKQTEILYLYGQQCTSMSRLSSNRYGGIEEVILDNTKIVIIREDNEGMGYTSGITMDFYYTVNNAEPELLFELYESSIDENGIIYSSIHALDEDGGRMYSLKNMYVDGKLVSIE